MMNRVAWAARAAWRAYTARPWAMVADATIMALLVGGIYWLCR